MSLSRGWLRYEFLELIFLLELTLWGQRMLNLYSTKILIKSFLTHIHIKIACRVCVAYLKEKINHFFKVFPNKLLKYVFNIILKLNNHPWKKYKISFLWKNEAQISVVSQSRKKLQDLKIIFFRKKDSSSLFVPIWSSKRCAEFF